MPTNEQRRAAAKRKLERQVERRAQEARRRKQLTIAGSIAGVIVVVAAAVGVYFLTNDDNDNSATAADDSFVSENTPGELPEPKAKPETVSCEYPPSGKPAAKPNNPPLTDDIATTGDDALSASLSIETNQGNIGLTLDNAHAPCTVNSFVSLASQGYFNDTPCHRLTTAGIKVLQCGDPTGTGSGGPGYEYANEYPTDQYAEGDPGVQAPVPYQRGVLAMANAGPGTNGSQFFIVYGDSQLPPQYTIFGTIDETGLTTLDKVAAAGVEGGGEDGPPALPVQLISVQLD